MTIDFSLLAAPLNCQLFNSVIYSMQFYVEPSRIAQLRLLTSLGLVEMIVQWTI